VGGAWGVRGRFLHRKAGKEKPLFFSAHPDSSKKTDLFFGRKKSFKNILVLVLWKRACATLP
jgi:hypothetical protein